MSLRSVPTDAASRHERAVQPAEEESEMRLERDGVMEDDLSAGDLTSITERGGRVTTIRDPIL